MIKSMQLSISDAQKKLSQLIKAVELGEPVTICRKGVPVVDLVPTREEVPRKRKRVFGSLRGKIKIIDPDWWKPMTDEQVDDFLQGRY